MQSFAGGSIANLCGAFFLSASVEVSEVVEAVGQLFRRNDALRMYVCFSDGVPSMGISADIPQIPILPFADRVSFDQYAETTARTAMPIQDHLAEISVVMIPGSVGILAKLHHLVSDAWCMTLIANQLLQLLAGHEPETHSYLSHWEQEEEYQASTRCEKDKAFFSEMIHAFPQSSFISNRPGECFVAQRLSLGFSKAITSKIRLFAEEHHVTPFAVLMAAYAACLARTRFQEQRMYIGTAVLNRTGRKEKNTVGLYINTVPLLLSVMQDEDFSKNVASCQETILSVFRHQRYNYGVLLSELHEKSKYTQPLYDVLISYQNASINPVGLAGPAVWYHNGMQTESLQIHIDDREQQGSFHIQYDYRLDKLEASQLRKLHHQVTLLLENALSSSEPLHSIELMDSQEKELILKAFNQTDGVYDCQASIHSLFRRQANKTPDAIALISDSQSFTFRELDRYSDTLASALRRQGICRGQVIPIISQRSWHIIVGILGILKAGAAFLNINCDCPADRVTTMLELCHASFVLYGPGAHNCGIDGINLLTFDYHRHLDAIPEDLTQPDDLAYIIFTSGSTGTPKGLMIRHRNAVNFCADSSQSIAGKIVKPQHRMFLSVTNVIFDMFITELLIPLTHGLTLLFATDDEALSAEKLSILCERFQPDVFETTPTKLQMYMQYKGMLLCLKQLKAIILGGEALPRDLYTRLRQETSACIYNNYGPAQTTVWSTIKPMTDDEITIGKPMLNTRIYVLDDWRHPVPINVPGEIYISGACVGSGYIGRQDLTAERYLSDPFWSGQTMYRTGDLACWNENGELVYLGRNDFQIKIRGLRIELGEIENVLESLPGIERAVVAVRKDRNGDSILCAFYTGTFSTKAELISSIRDRLTRYMLPQVFVHMDTLPMTATGKILRTALPAVDLTAQDSGQAYQAPATERQAVLCRLMEKVLRRERVGAADDFFMIGGDSLHAIEFMTLAHEERVFFNLQMFYQHPTAEGLDQAIEHGCETRESQSRQDPAIAQVIASNRYIPEKMPQLTPLKHVLLCGATGYLGAHILAECLDRGADVTCLVRGENAQICADRLLHTMQFYFGARYDDRMHSVSVLQGDLSQHRFGLQQVAYQKLLNNILIVINAAASVKHFGYWQDFYRLNVGSVLNLIDFCMQNGARLVHTSTLSVSGNSLADDFSQFVDMEQSVFHEFDLDIGQPLTNVYVRSKFMAQAEILKAVPNGLKANILRMGNLTNRYSDGMFQQNYESNAFLKRIRAMLALGVVPDYLEHIHVEFTPVDLAAKAVRIIAEHFSERQNVFHIHNTNVIQMPAFLALLASANRNIKLVSEDEFEQAMERASASPATAFIAQTFVNDMTSQKRLNYDSPIEVNSTYSTSYLSRLGFEWPKIDTAYIMTYLHYIDNLTKEKVET